MTMRALSILLSGHHAGQLRRAPGCRASRPHALKPHPDRDHDRPPCEKQMSRLPIRSAALATAAARLSSTLACGGRPPSGDARLVPDL